MGSKILVAYALGVAALSPSFVCFGEVFSRAGTWRLPRRVIVKAEATHSFNPNPRFVVTNLDGDACALYERGYCARENRFKACQFRLLITSLVYLLVGHMRRAVLAAQRLNSW